jgi:hypothetical protein
VRELGVEWNLALLNASHTHSGPYMLRSLIAGLGPAPDIEMAYFRMLEERLTATARAAARKMKPVEVRVFEGVSDVGINRRGGNGRAGSRMIPNPQGPYDSRVWVLKVSPADGTAPAVVFSYACHPVIVYGAAYSVISADFPGEVRQELRRALGESAHVQFVQGFGGNIRPRILADLEKSRFRASRSGELEQAGKSLAEAVLAALQRQGDELKLNLAGAGDRPFLPRGKPPERAVYEKMQAEARRTTNDFRLGVSEYWLKHYDSGEGFSKGDAWPLGLVRLAENQWVVYCGGEPCVEWRDKIAAWLKPLKIVTFGYTQERNPICRPKRSCPKADTRFWSRTMPGPLPRRLLRRASRRRFIGVSLPR